MVFVFMDIGLYFQKEEEQERDMPSVTVHESNAEQQEQESDMPFLIVAECNPEQEEEILNNADWQDWWEELQNAPTPLNDSSNDGSAFGGEYVVFPRNDDVLPEINTEGVR